MALSKANGSNTIYLSVADGNLVRSYKEANANTNQRVTKTGKLVHEERFKDLTAKLVGAETKENAPGIIVIIITCITGTGSHVSICTDFEHRTILPIQICMGCRIRKCSLHIKCTIVFIRD